MEKRTLITIVMAVLVFIFYPYYLKKFCPPKPQAEAVQESKPITNEEPRVLTENKIEPPVITTAPAAQEELVTISTPLMDVTFSNYEATIKDIKFLKYLDKNKKPIELVSPAPTEYRPMATNLPQSASAYTLHKEGNTLTCAAVTDTLKITKIYKINPASYDISASLIIENVGKKQVNLPSYTISVGTIFPVEASEEKQAAMYLGAITLIDGKPVRAKFGKPGFRSINPGRVFWSGVKNKYFTFILKPQNPAITSIVSDYQIDKKRGIWGQITMPETAISSGGKIEESFLLYAGPKKYEILKALGAKLDQIMDFGMFAPISIATLFILNLFYKIIPNYGIAIILLTILVKFILYPLTLKSYKSMREMHKLQPHIQELQKKYKDDPKRVNKEMMLLYKEHKVNPFSGCFPMLLQMPILIALFTTLRSAIELRGAPFILWIKDLAEPDTLMRLPNGFPINVLPIILVAAFYFQQKMTAMPSMNDQQKQQQKMMATIMPLFMGFIFYSFPSGLNLYFGLSTVLGIMDQRRIEKAKAK